MTGRTPHRRPAGATVLAATGGFSGGFSGGNDGQPGPPGGGRVPAPSAPSS